jgi:hypothetical protein
MRFKKTTLQLTFKLFLIHFQNLKFGQQDTPRHSANEYQSLVTHTTTLSRTPTAELSLLSQRHALALYYYQRVAFPRSGFRLVSFSDCQASSEKVRAYKSLFLRRTLEIDVT